MKNATFSLCSSKSYFLIWSLRQDNALSQPLLNAIDECIDDGNGLGLPQLEPFKGRQRPSHFFDRKQFLDLFEHPGT